MMMMMRRGRPLCIGELELVVDVVAMEIQGRDAYRIVGLGASHAGL